jgi:hypothetical protein
MIPAVVEIARHTAGKISRREHLQEKSALPGGDSWDVSRLKPFLSTD